jgi:hypothetical protein
VSVIPLALALALAAEAPPSREAPAEAKKLFRAGAQAYDAGNYLAAIRALQQSYELAPLPATLFSISQAYRLQYFATHEGRWLDRAIDGYRRYVETVPNGGRRADAVRLLGELEPLGVLRQPKAAKPEPPFEPPTTQLVIMAQASGATAAIERGPSGPVPLIADVTPGEHLVRVTAERYLPVEQKVVAIEGRLVAIDLTLPPAPAHVRLAVEPDLALSVDGRLLRHTSLGDGAIALEPGHHVLALSAHGREPWSEDLELSPGAELSLSPELPTTALHKLGWGLLTASGATAIGVAISGGLALSADHSARDIYDRSRIMQLSRPDAADYRSLVGRRSTDTTAAVAFGAATGALLAAALILLAIE